jgi:hypothetical protein
MREAFHKLSTSFLQAFPKLSQALLKIPTRPPKLHVSLGKALESLESLWKAWGKLRKACGKLEESMEKAWGKLGKSLCNASRIFGKCLKNTWESLGKTQESLGKAWGKLGESLGKLGESL